ncbi:MAG: hypothetical protein LBG95_05310 [Treponema sp.]|nr:hypothetical protein [Treponema sp.]
MRKLIKLALFFSLSFAVLFLISTGLRFLALRVEWVRALSQEQEAILVEFISAARWALSFGIYGGVLMGLSYAARKEVFAPMALICVIALTLGFTFGIDQFLKNWENVPPAKTSTPPLGRPGLILSNNVRSSGTSIVLLEGPSRPGGRRIVATPGKPMLYQAEFAGRDLTRASLPPAPFSDNCPWFLKSLAIDLRLNAEILRQRLNEGMTSFLIYSGALVFFLSSLIFILKLSAWPLANIVLGCLAFRGVLALEIFFNTDEMQNVFDSFLQNRLPLALAVPLIFCVIGVLIHLYSLLVFLAKRRRSDGY